LFCVPRVRRVAVLFGRVELAAPESPQLCVCERMNAAYAAPRCRRNKQAFLKPWGNARSVQGQSRPKASAQ